MTILADIGGTYARFSVAAGQGPERIRKYKAGDFEGLEQALQRYCEDEGLGSKGPLRVATAGYCDNGVWKFVNRNKWIIDPVAVMAQGWDLDVIINDFEAATWALRTLGAVDISILKKAQGASDSLCLLGPGTGLGLGYTHQNHVQKTHGGHIPVSALTGEQINIVQTVQKLKQQQTIAVFEDFVSGPGLCNIYTAFCLLNDKTVTIEAPEGLLDNADDAEVQNALRLFHELLGLFACTAVVSGNAYGGLYLTGGVLERLVAAGLFDFEHFEKWFCVRAVDSVARDLNATPVCHITYPYPALKGLLKCPKRI